MDTEQSEDDQGGLTDKEEPGNVGREPSAGSKRLDMGKQAKGRGLDNQGSEEEEANDQRRTQSEVVSNPKDFGAYQARNNVQERESNGKDGQEAQKPIVKPRPSRSHWDSSALPKSRQVGSEGSGVNSDMAGGSTHRTKDRPAGKGKTQGTPGKSGKVVQWLGQATEKTQMNPKSANPIP
ncbi:hypothetical protein PAXRUDRAFT_21793 [Paxillus rubicundulus Ve08.2h10]|uniref:Unplaced genomic scaffold scaffold_5820, whole genome shotgun sequence n=1 Tax=Paxillus rubicundulus Ve08.2h10 TaxID=930991 RepID=A0A0D0D6R2_9AGAM|nr:hypothetical protein PAXRUDRAFT_21793 [Paxillus rubicundulus Ve08.2h10]